MFHDLLLQGALVIDHLVVAKSGIWVIDAKQWRGRVEERDQGTFFHPDLRLFVGGQDRSDAIAETAR